MGLVPGNGEAGKGLRCGEHKLTERQEDGRRAVGRCLVPPKNLLSGDEPATMPIQDSAHPDWADDGQSEQ